MTDKEIAMARSNYCFGRTCRNCIFETYARNKFNTRCEYLTADQICAILSIIKEDKTMTNEEALRKEIDETMKQLDILQKKLEEVKNEVPEELIIKDNDEYYYVNDAGNVCMARCALLLSDARRVRKHRAFLSEEYAEVFAEKTQFIADMLHFKWLYDRDYIPDWSNNSTPKWRVCYNGCVYECDNNYTYRNPSVVYFSSEEIAEKCADWLNKKKGKE